jgi:hypothetical protein
MLKECYETETCLPVIVAWSVVAPDILNLTLFSNRLITSSV